MQFECLVECDGPAGQHWFAGDTYSMTRRDLYALKAANFDLAGNFAPADGDDAAAALFTEVTQPAE